ncbi:hypothetical protein F2Q68_00010133 [Brassica cretica]|uniref:Uncharacterized protein n=1 Tax=Brassica cretica TaxID=69181 RepID=A0A8S9KQX4_BRACR|nr:hypothetical protein F2Q68_00010133 [Brassica cretica]
MIYVFVEQEKLHEAEATNLRERFRASFDPYGSNVDLIGSETASQLITSREIVEEPFEEPTVDIRRPRQNMLRVRRKMPSRRVPRKITSRRTPRKPMILPPRDERMRRKKAIELRRRRREYPTRKRQQVISGKGVPRASRPLTRIFSFLFLLEWRARLFPLLKTPRILLLRIEDLYFKDEYIDAAFVRKRSDGSMNFLVEKYDSTLKQMMELEGKLKSDRASKKELTLEKTRLEQATAALEKEKAELLAERDAAVEKLIKERQRLKDSRSLEVTRDRERGCYDRQGESLLWSHSDLTLSPLLLPSRFVEERFRASFDPYGSNVDLIGSETASQLITSREIVEKPSEEPMVDITSAPTEHAADPEKDALEESPEKDNPEENPETYEDEEEEGDRAKKTPSPKLNEEETTSDIGKGSSSSIPSSNADLLVPVQVEGPILVHVPARVEDPIVSVAEDPEDPPAPSVLSGNEQDSADGVLIREERTENVGIEDPVLVSDTSSKGREDEEDEGDRAEKTPSPKPNEEETTSEIEKGSASSIPSSNADLLVPVPAQVEGPILVPVPARVEGRIVSVAEDTEDPPALSVLNGNKQDSAA